MAPSREFHAPDAIEVVNSQAIVRAHDLEQQLHLGIGGRVCEYVVDKYHHFDNMYNSHPDQSGYIRNFYLVGKFGTGQAAKYVCDIEHIDKVLQDLRGKANEFKENQLVKEYQQFLRQLGHLKADALEVLVTVAPQKALTYGENANAAKALRRKNRGADAEAAAA